MVQSLHFNLLNLNQYASHLYKLTIRIQKWRGQILLWNFFGQSWNEFEPQMITIKFIYFEDFWRGNCDVHGLSLHVRAQISRIEKVKIYFFPIKKKINECRQKNVLFEEKFIVNLFGGETLEIEARVKRERLRFVLSNNCNKNEILKTIDSDSERRVSRCFICIRTMKFPNKK